MIEVEYTTQVPLDTAATGQSVAITTSSAASSNAIGDRTAVIYSTVEVFIVRGASPTATVAVGLPIPPGVAMRIHGLELTDKIAGIATSGSGTLYIRPGL